MSNERQSIRTIPVEEKSLPRRIYDRVRASLLLSVAVFGAVLMVISGVADLVLNSGDSVTVTDAATGAATVPTWTGLTAASGLLLVVVNLLGYVIYVGLKRRY